MVSLCPTPAENESERESVKDGDGDYARRQGECSLTSSCKMDTDPISAALVNAVSI